MIKVSHLKKSFDGRTWIVNDLSFEVGEGELLVLLGSSGSGKTSTLKMLNRLVEPTSGTVMINDQKTSDLDPVKLRRTIGYVFQGIGLFPHLTILDNIILVLKLQNINKIEQFEQARYYLELVNLDPNEFSKRYPAELSGGQQQRVGVARALATNSDILLMDEPFGALDAINRNALQDELLSLKSRLQKTIVFVTHDIFEALKLGDRIAILNKGRLEQIDGKKEIIMNPTTEYVRELFSNVSKQLAVYSSLLDV